jgi:FdhD protein
LSADERAADNCWSATSVARWRGNSEKDNPVDAPTDAIAEEVAVALSYNGVSHVVMMMTPANLADFALGFSLSEGIIDEPGDIYAIEIVTREQGIEVALTVSARHFMLLKERRRNLTGRTGCGICGAESLEQALQPVPRVARGVRVDGAAIERARARLAEHQPLQHRTGAVHAAAWCSTAGDILLVREDVGRHNALDKLIGALAQRKERGAGFALVSSRASYEMVTKAARVGIEMLVAVSAPTALAVRLARESDLTLVGFAREGRFSVYTASERVVF